MLHTNDHLTTNFLTTLKRKVCKTYYWQWKIIAVTLLASLYYFGSLTQYHYGTITRLFELNYDTDFNYPLKRNITECVDALAVQKFLPRCDVINSYNYTYVFRQDTKCIPRQSVALVLIIKSAVANSHKRSAIRQTWGDERRFRNIRRVFVLGVTGSRVALEAIRDEQDQYNDIVLADFDDTYQNTTIKLMMAFKWAYLYCDAKFYLFADDDVYISMKNILNFIRNPYQYPDYLRNPSSSQVSHDWSKSNLISGFVLPAPPHRFKSSKWYVSLQEYPYDKWPPYVSGSSYVVSNHLLKKMYLASHFTKHFRFDDVYVGILAKKLNVQILNCDSFFFQPYDKNNFKYVLSSHSYSPSELITIWNEQKDMGNA